MFQLSRLTIILLCSLAVFASCAPSSTVERRGPRPPELKADKSVAVEPVKAPWQLWNNRSFGVPEFEQAEEHLRRGELLEAVRLYKQVESTTKDPKIYEEAFLRRVGTELKLGQSRVVLEDISAFLARNGVASEKTPAPLSLIVGYAYTHQKNADQSLAWFGVTYRRVDGQGEAALRAIEESRRIVRGVTPNLFSDMAARWSGDNAIGPLFAEEQARRTQGGRPEFDVTRSWFVASTYGTTRSSGEMLEADLAQGEPTLSQEGEVVIGVLLPLSGRFAEHAERVKQGIQLAAEEFGQTQRVRFVFADTEGEPAKALREYEALASQEQAVAVLGPLLVTTTEVVAAATLRVGVPIVSFTKREGIPEIGPAVFRLGATVDNQVVELVSFAVEELGFRTFSTMYPENSGGEEFAEIFRTEVQARKGTVLTQVGYRVGDEESMRDAVGRVSKLWPEAIFIPDALENTIPLLEEIQSSELSRSMLLGPAYWNDPVALRGFGQLLDGAIYVAPFYSLSTNPNVQQFIERYRALYQREPELLSAQAFDATALLLAAIDNAKRRGGTVSEQFIALPELEGVTGKLKVSPVGEITRRMSILHLQNGEVVEVMSRGTVTGYVNVKEKTKS